MNVCKICLVGNTTHSVINNVLRSLFENMTNIKFYSEDARPRALCCYCYQKLLKCHTFTQMALRSEQIFTRLIENGHEITHEYLAEVNPNKKLALSMATVQFVSTDTKYASQVTIKEETRPRDTTEEVTTEPDNLHEDCTKGQSTLDDNNSDQENYKEKLHSTIPAELVKPDDSKITFPCSLCNKIFDKQSKLISHKINAHSQPTEKQYPSTGTTNKNQNVKRQFTCNVCDKKYNYKHVLATHMKIHLEQKPFACKVCDKQFYYKHTLSIHMRTHTGERPFACKVCDKQFYYKQALTAHMITHTGERPFACKVCDKRFILKHHLLQHIKIHVREKPLDTHILNTNPQHTVKDSGTTRMNEDQILQNVKKQFACHACDKKYDHKSAFNRHIRTHTGEKPFACNTCDKQFSRKSTLVLHMRIHSGDKPLACNVCGRSFNQKHHLLDHLKTHSEQKPLACNVCDKTFNLKQNLVFHLRTHLKERPFACMECDKQFYRKHHLMRHMTAFCLRCMS